MTTIKKIQKEIERIIKKSPYNEDLPHAKLVLKNVLTQKPDADEALQISALAHDIERAVPPQILLEQFNTREKYKHAHSIRSSQIIRELLWKFKYEDNIINKVTELVEQHEVGKQGDAKVLKESDSLAYFQFNINIYYERFGLDRTRKKIQYMYNRLSKPAQKIAKKIKLSPELKKIFINTIQEQ